MRCHSLTGDTHVQLGLQSRGEACRHHVAAPDGLDLLHQAELGLRQQLELDTSKIRKIKTMLLPMKYLHEMTKRLFNLDQV